MVSSLVEAPHSCRPVNRSLIAYVNLMLMTGKQKYFLGLRKSFWLLQSVLQLKNNIVIFYEMIVCLGKTLKSCSNNL